MTFIEAVTLVLPWVAVIVATTLVEVAVVVTVNVAVVEPDATVTLDGTVAHDWFDERLTTRPPDGAAVLSVTVPVDEFPPETVVGDKLTLDRYAGVIVNVAD
jgi:hypothetical protein